MVIFVQRIQKYGSKFQKTFVFNKIKLAKNKLNMRMAIFLGPPRRNAELSRNRRGSGFRSLSETDPIDPRVEKKRVVSMKLGRFYQKPGKNT